MLKASVASMLVSGWDYKIYFSHNPILSSNDTTDRTATVVINSNHAIGAGANAPRLYYKIGSGSFNHINAFYNNLDTFKFSIPGKPLGTTVSYYFAAQDALANFIGTYPYGGRGMNPPGSTPPANLFVYEVANINTIINVWIVNYINIFVTFTVPIRILSTAKE